MKIIFSFLLLLSVTTVTFAAGSLEQDPRLSSWKPWLTDIMTWEQLDKAHALIPSPKNTALAAIFGSDNNRVLNVYFDDQFSDAMFPDRKRYSKKVNGVDKLLTHQDRYRRDPRALKEWGELCHNVKTIEGYSFDQYYCGYKDKNGKVIDPKQMTLNALGRWSSGIKLYLDHVIIPIFNRHGDYNEVRYLKHLSKEIIPYPHFVKFVSTPDFADLIIQIPWSKPGEPPPYRDRAGGNECSRDSTNLDSSYRKKTDFRRARINLPLSDPKKSDGGKCMTENTLVHEVGHALGLADMYVYGHAKKKNKKEEEKEAKKAAAYVNNQPHPTMMRSLLNFSGSHSFAGDDLMMATALLIQSHYNEIGKKRYPGLRLFDRSRQCLRRVAYQNQSGTNFGCLETKEAKKTAKRNIGSYLFDPRNPGKNLKRKWAALSFKNVRRAGKQNVYGTWKNAGSVRIGKGVYKGTFDKNWLPDGTGNFHFDDGTVERQFWSHGQYISLAPIEYSNGKFYGRVRVVGKEWRREFRGTMVYKGKHHYSYVGSWKNHKKHGYGELKKFDSDGFLFIKGHFDNDKVQGKATQLYQSNSLNMFILTEGHFHKSKLHGYGRVVIAEKDPKNTKKWITTSSCKGKFANKEGRNVTTEHNIKSPNWQELVQVYKKHLGIRVEKIQDKGTVFETCLLKKGKRIITGKAGSQNFKSVFTGNTGNGTQMTGEEYRYINGKKVLYIRFANNKVVEQREFKPEKKKVVKQIKDIKYLALAWNNKTGMWERRRSNNKQAAESKALSRCRKKHGKCRLVVTLDPKKVRCIGIAKVGSWVTANWESINLSSTDSATNKLQKRLKEKVLKNCRKKAPKGTCYVSTMCNNKTRYKSWGAFKPELDGPTLARKGWGLQKAGKHNEAKRAYEQAAAKGDGFAMNQLGHYAQMGLAGKKDLRKSFEWYLKSAKKGYGWGLVNTASAYWQGRGTRKNLKQAAYWYEKAAQKNVRGASENLAKVKAELNAGN